MWYVAAIKADPRSNGHLARPKRAWATQPLLHMGIQNRGFKNSRVMNRDLPIETTGMGESVKHAWT